MHGHVRCRFTTRNLNRTQSKPPSSASVVVAHRLSTIIKSDNIAVLKKGVVVEQGTHTQLMAPSAVGHYRQLMSTQQTAYLND